jgi:hypothetical protein
VLRGTEPEMRGRGGVIDFEGSSYADLTLKSLAADLVYLNRTFEFDTIPITLLQKGFGEFRDDCELTPSIEAQDLLQTLTTVTCQYTVGITVGSSKGLP